MGNGETFVRSHRKLLVWQAAIDLAKAAYEVTERFAESERFGLTQQMRRAAVSVASNIAEGAGRASAADKAHFFVMAQGSLSELDTQLEIASSLGYLSGSDKEGLAENIGRTSRLLSGLIRSKRGK
jgi:four helix bundle protein